MWEGVLGGDIDDLQHSVCRALDRLGHFVEPSQPRWATKPEARSPARQQWFYWALVVAGAVLIGLNFATGTTRMEWMPFGTKEQILLVVALVGLGVTWWARIHLGTLWSGTGDAQGASPRSSRPAPTPSCVTRSMQGSVLR